MAKITLLEEEVGFSVWHCPTTVQSAFADTSGHSRAFYAIEELLKPPTTIMPSEAHAAVAFQASWTFPNHVLNVISDHPAMATAGLMEMILQICGQVHFVYSDPTAAQIHLRHDIAIQHSDFTEDPMCLSFFVPLSNNHWYSVAKNLAVR